MLKTFRNIAATLITWYVYGFVADILWFAAMTVIPLRASSDQPGSVFLMILLGALPYIVVAVFAGAILMNVVKPTGDARWVRLLAIVITIGYFTRYSFDGGMIELPPEKIAAFLMVAFLLVGAVLFGGGRVASHQVKTAA